MVQKSHRIGESNVFRWGLVIGLLCILTAGWMLQAANVRDRREPLPTRWMAGDGSRKLPHAVPAYAEPLRMIPAGLPVFPGLPSGRPAAGAVSTRMLLVVENSLYPSIQTKLQRFVQDLQKEGWTVLVYRFGSGTAQSLRTYLRSRYKEKGGWPAPCSSATSPTSSMR